MRTFYKRGCTPSLQTTTTEVRNIYRYINKWFVYCHYFVPQASLVAFWTPPFTDSWTFSTDSWISFSANYWISCCDACKTVVSFDCIKHLSSYLWVFREASMPSVVNASPLIFPPFFCSLFFCAIVDLSQCEMETSFSGLLVLLMLLDVFRGAPLLVLEFPENIWARRLPKGFWSMIFSISWGTKEARGRTEKQGL